MNKRATFICRIKEVAIGLFGLGLYILNTIIWFVVIMLLTGLYYLIPVPCWRWRVRSLLEYIPNFWIRGNIYIQKLTIPRTRWITKYKPNLSIFTLNPHAWYLLISNHQSWVDILVLQRLFNQRAPLMKFFLKSELLWKLPLISWVCWLLEFPFIRRYNMKQLLQNPALRMYNLENTKRVCERYKTFPTTIINFVEGKRFTSIRRKRQASSYRHLLRPQGGGIALSLAVLNHQLDKIIHVTILYSNALSSFWDFICGRIARITVYTEMLPITPDLIGDYIQDQSFRLHIQQWLNRLWERKDKLIQNEEIQGEWLSHEV